MITALLRLPSPECDARWSEAEPLSFYVQNVHGSVWASFLAIVSCSDLVRVTTSPRSSWAKASVVTGALESRDEIAASRASISIVVCGSSGVAGGI